MVLHAREQRMCCAELGRQHQVIWEGPTLQLTSFECYGFFMWAHQKQKTATDHGQAEERDSQWLKEFLPTVSATLAKKYYYMYDGMFEV